MRNHLIAVTLALLTLLPTVLAGQRPPDPTVDPFCPYPDGDWYTDPHLVLCIDSFRNPQPLTAVRTTPMDALVQAYGYAITIPNAGEFGIACAVVSVSEGANPPVDYAPCVGTRGDPIGPALYVAFIAPTTSVGAVAYLVEATLHAHYDEIGVLGTNILVVCQEPTCGSPVLLA